MSSVNLVLLFFAGVISFKDFRDQLREIAVTYEANRLSLSAAKIKFRYHVGLSVSPEAIRSPSWAIEGSADGLYVFEADRSRYEVVFSLEDMKRNTKQVGENEFTMGNLNSFRILGKGTLRLLDNLAVFPGANDITRSVTIDESPVIEQDIEFPLGLGFKRIMVRGLLRDIDTCLSGTNASIRCETIESKDYRGAMCTLVRFSTSKNRREYIINKAQGMIPLRTIEVPIGQTTPTFEEEYSDVRMIGKTWIPFLTASKRQFRGVRLEIVEVMSGPPKPSDFALEFPRPQHVDNLKDQVAYKPRTRWSLDELPDKNSAEAKKFQIPPANFGKGEPAPGGDPEVMAEQLRWRAFYVRLALGLLIGAIIVFGVVAWRRRRPS